MFGFVGANERHIEVKLVRLMIVFVKEDDGFGCEVVDFSYFGCLNKRRVTCLSGRLRL